MHDLDYTLDGLFVLNPPKMAALTRLAKVQMAKHSLITLAYNSPEVKPDTTYAWNGL
ncbi:MAG TPA: hypothetical protein VKV19_03710 [Ktedonobacteraceae bacterium]|nr:hypothetical protein [Ktedonobacteraceae bacterium]